MNQLNLSNSDVRNHVHAIIRKIYDDDFKPDYIVGLTRGGLIPAVMLSHYLNVPMYSLHVSLRDDHSNNCETNCWMSEDAFGYVPLEEQEIIKSRWDITKKKKILIVDDINDSGATFDWIKQDWEGSCFPKEKSTWNAVWGNNVRFAVLVNNLNSAFQEVDYFGTEINKLEDPDLWINFPWEHWWEN